MRVRLDRWGGAEPLDATVRVVEPRGFLKISALGVEEQRVWVICDIDTPHSKRAALGDGYRVEASFILWASDDVVQVPTSALFRRDDQAWAVFVRDSTDDIARVRGVEVGRRSGLRAQIVSGLEPGDEVILHAPRELEDGSRIERPSS